MKNPVNDSDKQTHKARIRRIRRIVKQSDPHLYMDKCFNNVGYEPGLKQRLVEMFTESNGIVNIGDEDSIKDFCAKTYAARNFHTHYLPDMAEPMSTDEYIIANHKLKYVIEYFIMKEIGISNARKAKIFDDKYWYHIPLKSTWKQAVDGIQRAL